MTMIRTTLDKLSDSAWLYHAPYLYHAIIHDHTRILVDVYELNESNEHTNGNEAEAKIFHQRQLCISSQCSQSPRILCFVNLYSRDDGQIQPHLVIYDPTIGQLECHAIELEDQVLVASIGLDLSRMQLYSTILSTTVVIALKSNRINQNHGFDLLAWTPKEKKLLQAYMETDHIVGIQDCYINQSWFILYTSISNNNQVVVSTSNSLFGHAHHRGFFTAPVFQLDSVPIKYGENIVSVVTLGHYRNFRGDTLPVPTDVLFDRIWAQTRSDELVYFSQGSIQWSSNMSSPVKEMILTECQTSDKTPLLCVLVHTEDSVCLYDAVVGRLLKSWLSSEFNVILSDIRNVGFYLFLIFSRSNQDGAMKCSIYPTSIGTTTIDSINSKQGDFSKATGNMDSALVALKKQQELRLNKIQRLEESLASKREVIQSCQEMADGPLRDVFRMDGVNHSFEDSMPIELLQLLRMKRSERRKRVLDRLTPIIGRTIDSGFLPNLNQDSSSSAVSSPTQPIRTLECVSGWLKTATRKILWIGAHIENQSDQVLSNLYLTISQYNCSGQKLPQVVPQSTGLVVILVQIDSSDQNESTNRSRVEMELNSSTVRLHVEQTLDQNVIQYSVLMTNIRLVDNCPNIWRSALVENILPYKVGCRLDNIANARLLVLIQDVFSLSPNEDYTVFGSLEEGIIAKISPAANSMQGTSWDVSFQVGTEAAAHDCARRSSLLCPRFAGDRIG